ncbi:pyrrolidone-carboxylate peptidase [Arthrobacter sp. MYb229]|uniref:pyroglutamyl-peptidase I n=1 Tax=Glutamicibacter sp. AOP12-B1-11 TaxID=3457725 RepID=UPI000CFB3163|nr:pyrrolidone-carboxylate peptidase [Arthrobacter sp. MYb229]PRB52061.1 pyrrolidone-carboxylate peptidase [Arthrobacter sp. MYb216]
MPGRAEPQPMRILVTGFEPFGTDTHNASAEIVRRLPATAGEHQIVTGLLPVSFSRAFPTLGELLRTHQPDALVLLGEAGGRTEINLERWAVNENNARIADNDGHQPAGERIAPNGAHRREATLETPSQLRVSEDAGRFLCNHIAYHAYGLGIPAQFIHVPAWRPGNARALVGAETDDAAGQRSALGLAELVESLTEYLLGLRFRG